MNKFAKYNQLILALLILQRDGIGQSELKKFFNTLRV